MAQPQLSIQLYSVNDQLVADPDGTLAKLAEMGLRQVEAYAFVDRAESLAEAFRGTASKPRPVMRTCCPTSCALVTGSSRCSRTTRSSPQRRRSDSSTSSTRWLPSTAGSTPTQITDTAARLNAAAEKAADHGLRVGYHNHAQEFVATIDGRSGYEYFVDQLHDDVMLEVDVFWAATAKVDVTALLRRLGDRVKALHVKDGFVGVNPFVVDAAPLDKAMLDQRSAGQGELPMLDYLAASPSTDYAVIEFDHFAGDIFDGVQGSVEFFHANGIK